MQQRVFRRFDVANEHSKPWAIKLDHSPRTPPRSTHITDTPKPSSAKPGREVVLKYQRLKRPGSNGCHY